MTIRQLLLCLGLFLISSFVGCDDNITNPYLMGENSICYEKLYSGQWEVFSNNLKGTNPQNISEWKYTDNNNMWSPDGRYIGFTRQDPIGDQDLYLYDNENKTRIGLITSDSISTDIRLWTPSGKIIYYKLDMDKQLGSYCMIDADGSNDREIYGSPIFFFSDSYSFLSANQNLIYRTNIDGTFNELLLDISTIGNNYVNYHDFDPLNNKILILADPTTPQITNLLVTYQIESGVVDTISIADSGWLYLRPKFSSNFDRIAVAEVFYATSNVSYRISIITNGIKTVLVELGEKDVALDYRPFAFSPDDKYLAYAKSILQSGTTSSKTYIYVVDLQTKQETYIDEGNRPQWNPAYKY